MKRRNATRSALFTSIISLLLCVSMLVGTTFAWFTDEVVSGNNVIAAGNLDVELYNDLTINDVKKVSTTTKLFDEITYWEPGVVAYENLTVANVGSLALKYQLAINFTNATTNANGDTLAKVLKVGFVEGGIESTVREDAITEVKTWQALESFVQAGMLDAAVKDLTAANTTDTYGIVIYWEPSDIDNEFNMNNANKGKVMSIDLGVKLFATQLEAESDSFGPDYDGGANWITAAAIDWYAENPDATEFVLTSAEDLAGLAALVNGTATTDMTTYAAGQSIPCVDFADKTIKLANDIDLAGNAWTPIGDVDAADFVGFKGTFDGQGHTISNLYINSNSWGQGLFGYMDASTNATIQNVNVKNANVKGTDNCGVIVGYATNGTFSNIHVSGDVSVIGTAADGYVGGIAGCGYNATFDKCSVEGAKISSEGSFAGGIVGYQCNNAKQIANCSVKNSSITGYGAVGGIAGIIQTGSTAISGCTVETVVLTKTRVDGNPSIGALFGCYSGTAATILSNNTVNNVTLNGSYVAYAAYNELYGSNYSGATDPNFDISTTTATNITNNLNVIVPVKNETDLKNALANGGDNYVLTADITATGSGFNIPAGTTVALDLNGHNLAADFSAITDGASSLFLVNKGASLKINGDGKLHVNAAKTVSHVSSIFTNLGNLEINGGTYTMTYGTYAEGYLIPTIVDTNSNVGKATTTINGGEFYHNRNMFRNFAQPNRGANNATLIINGGTFVGEADDFGTIWNQKTSASGVEGDGIVTINGGDFQYMDVCNDFATGVTIADGLNIAVQS